MAVIRLPVRTTVMSGSAARKGELPKSWLWHYDAVAPGILKLMVYLNGADASSGALRVAITSASPAHGS